MVIGGSILRASLRHLVHQVIGRVTMYIMIVRILSIWRLRIHPPHDSPTQEPLQHSGPGTTDISSSSYLASQSWESRIFDSITKLYNQLTDIKAQLRDLEDRQRRIEYAHEFLMNEE